MSARELSGDVWRYCAATELAAARRVTDALIEVCRIGPRCVVLDVACGGGNPSVRIAARVVRGGAVFAVDSDGARLGDLPAVADAAGPRNLFVCRAQAERLPFADAVFDVATCRFGLMFFARPADALAELRRVLRPGARAGFAVFGAREENSLYIAIEAAFADIGEAATNCSASVFRFSGHGALEVALRASGFEVVETRSVSVAFDGAVPEVLLRHILRTTYSDKLAGLSAARRGAFARCLRNRLAQAAGLQAPLASYRVVAARP